MKWGRKKLSSSSSCTRPHLISHVFPISWLSKFKRMNISSESKPAKEKLKVKQNSASMSSPKSASGVGERFYSGDGDAFWRLSFGEEGVEGKTSRGVSRSVLYDSDDELEVPPSSFRSCGSNDTKVMIKEDSTKFDNVVRDVKKMTELDRDVEISPEIDICGRVKGAVIKTPRKRIEKEMKLRKANQRVLEEKWLELETESHEAEGISTKSVEKDASEMESVRTIWTIERENCKSTAADSRKHRYVSSINSRNTNLRTIEEECVLAAKNYDESDALSAEKMSLDWQKLKEMKIEELKLKNDKQRKSLYISRELPRRRTKQNSRVRVNSPRTPSKVEICKIKAIEDMKKAKLKMRKKAKERTVEKYSGLESFAVVKCSFDPQKDFRDSMIEMIMEKRISRPEELEELLACYLTLNSDEYHDLIIKVFRQVWFDMNQASFSTELQNEQCCND